MTTPILPTKTILLSYTLTPTQLIRDQEVETTLANHYAMITAMMSAWRAGRTNASYNAGDAGTAITLRDILRDEYEYWVDEPTPQTVNLVIWSWAQSNPY